MRDNELRSLIRSIIVESSEITAGVSPEDLRFSMAADYDVAGLTKTLSEIAQNLRTVGGAVPRAPEFADFFEALAAVPVADGGMRGLLDSLELDDDAKDVVVEDWSKSSRLRDRSLQPLFSRVYGYISVQARGAAGGSAEYLEYLETSLRELERELAAVNPAELRKSTQIGRGLHALGTGRIALTPSLLKDLRAAKRRLGGWGRALEAFLESLAGS